jgi:hypothetical protein
MCRAPARRGALMVKENKIHRKKNIELKIGMYLRISVFLFILLYVASVYLNSIGRTSSAEILETWCFIYLIFFVGMVIIGIYRNKSVHWSNPEENTIIKELVFACLKDSPSSYGTLFIYVRKKLDERGIFFITQRQIVQCIDIMDVHGLIFERDGIFSMQKDEALQNGNNGEKYQIKKFLTFRNMQKIHRVLVWGFLGFPVGFMIWIIGASGLIKIPGYVQIGYILLFGAVISSYVSVWLLEKIYK